MGADEPRASVFQLVASLGEAIDMMSPVMADHHARVAYLAFRMAEALEWPPEEQRTLALAGFVHDIGAFSLRERRDLLQFEDTAPGLHAQAGYLLLREFPPFEAMAEFVRFHHVPWNHGAGATQDGAAVPQGSHLLHLADRVAVLIAPDKPILGQVTGICEDVARRKGEVFVPQFVDAFLALARKDYIWLEATSDATGRVLRRHLERDGAQLGMHELLSFARLLCRVIDFKSPFTATHSSGVAATAVAVARLAGFPDDKCQMIQIAAYLHDLGKLAIPVEILDKPGPLTQDEWAIMRTHVYHTYAILDPIDALRTITSWGALHQERLNGTGYPFCREAADLPLGARIMAVADVFTGITEDRPYRKAMDKDAALEVLHGMADRRELDASLVKGVHEHFDEINTVRAAAQEESVREYQAFLASLQ